VEGHFKLEWMEHPWHDVAEAARWLLQLEGLISPDVVHLNEYAHATLPWKCPVLVVAHSCVLSWWQDVKATHVPNEWSHYRRHVRRGLHAADWLIAPSHAMAAAVQRHYDVSDSIEVIYNAADGSRFAPGDKHPFIFSAGRLWDDAKNIQALAAVAHAVSWPILVAGERQSPDGTSHECGELRFLGQLGADDVAARMASASIYALPARYEPFGLSILEAALSGCVLVLGDIPSLREIWGPAALYVNPDDHKQLAATLECLIANPAWRIALARAARARAVWFSPERMADRYMAAYAKFIQSRRIQHCGIKDTSIRAAARARVINKG
jgi:glycosyltransferase involved in cell wall biosynthesis